MSKRVGIASLIWMGAILASRVMGLVREAVLGRTLGAGGEADVYMVAFVIPDWMNYALAGGALSIVFIPIFGGYLAKNQEERGWESFSVIANFLLMVLVVLVGALWWLTPVVVDYLYSGFDAGQRVQLTRLTRIILPAQAFHIVGGLMSASLQARDRHVLPAIAPLLYTGSIVAGGLVTGTAEGFAWGVVVGSVLGPFGLPFVGCIRHGLRWRPIFSLTHEDLRTYLWRAFPIMIAFSVVAVDDWVFRTLATDMDEGSVALTTYAKNLMKVPIGVFGLAIGAATFPTLTRLVAGDQRDEARKTVLRAVSRIAVLALAAQVVFTTAGPEISRVIYGARITDAQHELLGIILAVMCLSLWAWSTQTMIARGFYAVGKTWVPSLLGTAVLVVCLPLYMYLGRVYGPPGLAGAGAVAIAIYVLVLGILLQRELGSAGRTEAGYLALALRVLPCLVLGIAVGHGVDRLLVAPWWLDWTLVVRPLLRGLLVGSAGLGTYVVMALVLRVPGFEDLVAQLRRRLARSQASDAQAGAGRGRVSAATASDPTEAADDARDDGDGR